MHLSEPNDRTALEIFLAKHPDTVNAHYGASCGTPLHSAASLGREDIASLLVKKGADLRARDSAGRTPLSTAAMYGRTGVVALLLASGADANARGPAEEPPLSQAVNGLPGDSGIDTRLEVTKLLLLAGADVNARGPDGRTPLVHALGSGRHENRPIIVLLLEHGADVRAKDTLCNAVADGKDVVELLIDSRAAQRGPGHDESPLGEALSCAAYSGEVETAKLLVDRGADLNWRYSGPLPLEWQSRPLAVALTVARSADRAAMARRRVIARMLIDHGANVNVRNQVEETLLHAAAEDGDLEAIDMLLAGGATVAARDRAGFTPLHRAVQTGHVDIARRLIGAGADVDAATSDGSTALTLASNDREMETLIRSHAKN